MSQSINETSGDKVPGKEMKDEAKEVADTIKSKNKKDDVNNNFRKVEKEGVKVFVCNIWHGEFSETKRVRQHITMKHRPRSISDDEDDDSKKLKKDDMLDESMLQQFNGSMVTS